MKNILFAFAAATLTTIAAQAAEVTSDAFCQKLHEKTKSQVTAEAYNSLIAECNQDLTWKIQMFKVDQEAKVIAEKAKVSIAKNKIFQTEILKMMNDHLTEARKLGLQDEQENVDQALALVVDGKMEITCDVAEVYGNYLKNRYECEISEYYNREVVYSDTDCHREDKNGKNSYMISRLAPIKVGFLVDGNGKLIKFLGDQFWIRDFVKESSCAG